MYNQVQTTRLGAKSFSRKLNVIYLDLGDLTDDIWSVPLMAVPCKLGHFLLLSTMCKTTSIAPMRPSCGASIWKWA